MSSVSGWRMGRSVGRVAAAAALCVIAWAWSGAAGLAADADNGRRITERWCTGCHATGAGHGTDAAPPFTKIANDPTRTDASLRAWLADPHPPMPNMSLTAREIDDVIAYLKTLRR